MMKPWHIFALLGGGLAVLWFTRKTEAAVDPKAVEAYQMMQIMKNPELATTFLTLEEQQDILTGKTIVPEEVEIAVKEAFGIPMAVPDLLNMGI
jgi:hypothetical protein